MTGRDGTTLRDALRGRTTPAPLQERGRTQLRCVAVGRGPLKPHVRAGWSVLVAPRPALLIRPPPRDLGQGPTHLVALIRFRTADVPSRVLLSCRLAGDSLQLC